MTERLVLLPGLDGTSVLFEPIVAALAKGSTRPTPIAYPQSLPSTYESLLPLVLRTLPDNEDYVLLGWSFSGPLALMAAATQPPGLRGIILCASFVTKPVFYLPKMVRHLARPFLFKFFEKAARTKALLGGYRTPELDELMSRAHGQVPSEVMASRVRETLMVDVQDELRECPVPILYLGATRDLIVPRTNAQRIQRHRPDVQMRLVKGPHVALASNPEDSAREIETFCASIE